MFGKRNFHKVKEPSIIIVPMIDIMLFLLVFFMMATMYMTELNTMSVNLPQASASKRETKPEVIPVTVLDNGEVYYDKDTSPSQDVVQRMKKNISENPEVVFVLRADKSTNYNDVTKVLDALKQSGAKHISLATEVKADKK